MNLPKFPRVRKFFFVKDGSKDVLDTRKLKYIGTSIVCIYTLCMIFVPDEYANLSKSQKGFTGNENINIDSKNVSSGANTIINTHQANFEAQERAKLGGKRKIPLVPQNVNFSASQVITRSGIGGTMKPLPSGSTFIGKLLDGVDTRNQNQILKVTLPYGARNKSGGTVPKNTILLGVVSYSGKGEKVYISFNRAVFPNGKEYKINAQALTSKDYSPGLIGEYHGNTDLRVAAAMGLTMVSAASEVLTTKAALGGVNQQGQSTIVTDATMENAMLQGISKVSEKEATRQARELESEQAFVTVEAGSDLIVSLLTPFKGELY